jgi:hypothetical protein
MGLRPEYTPTITICNDRSDPNGIAFHALPEIRAMRVVESHGSSRSPVTGTIRAVTIPKCSNGYIHDFPRYVRDGVWSFKLFRGDD